MPITNCSPGRGQPCLTLRSNEKNSDVNPLFTIQLETLLYKILAQQKRQKRQQNTNTGHSFLTLVEKHFPIDHKLRKIFNRNTIDQNQLQLHE